MITTLQSENLIALLASIHLCLVSFICNAQVEPSEINIQNSSINTLWTYQDVKIDWKIDGQTQLLLNEGITNLYEKKPDLAIEQFETILKNDEQFWIASYYKGVCYKLLKKYRDAREVFIQLIRVKHDFQEAYLELGKTLILMKSWNEAEYYLSECARNFPDNVNASYLIGENFLLKGFPQTAKPFYEKCEKIYQFVPAKVRLGMIELIVNKNTDAALMYFNNALVLDSIQSEALWFRFLINKEMAPKMSLNDINVLIRHQPTNLLFPLEKGLILVKLNDFENAFINFYKFLIGIQLNEDKVKGKQTAFDKKVDVQNAGFYLVRTVRDLSSENSTLAILVCHFE